MAGSSDELLFVTSHDEARDKHASDAAVERLWTYTIGITNRALARTGTEPGSGLLAKEWELPGSGLAAVWEGNHFILTAAHVIENATIDDLGFFAKPTTSLTRVSESEIGMDDAFPAISLAGSDAKIHRCDWEDLALITVDAASFGPYVEFADITKIPSVDPQENETVVGLGYPVSSGLIFQQRQQQGPEIKKTVLLCPIPFDGNVLPAEKGQFFKYFDAEYHYLIPFELALTGKHPRGISGAAAWVQSKEKQPIWTPRFLFAGIFTRSYKDDGSIVQVVKASVVQRFLSEVLGN